MQRQHQRLQHGKSQHSQREKALPRSGHRLEQRLEGPFSETSPSHSGTQCRAARSQPEAGPAPPEAFCAPTEALLPARTSAPLSAEKIIVWLRWESYFCGDTGMSKPLKQPKVSDCFLLLHSRNE